jgi:hypothetical protein
MYGSSADAAQVRFNVIKVLPKTGKAVKQFSKF